MDADLQAYLDWLRGHGARFTVAPELAQDADHDGPVLDGLDALRPVELDGIPPFVEHRDVARALGSDHATMSVAHVLLPRLALGARFWDVGCGTGVLAVAAGLKGARAVVATDVDDRALALARRTAADANVAVRFCHGSLLDPVPEGLEADVVAANLPHKPCPEGCGLPVGQAGGEDGAAVHEAFAAQAATRLASGARVFFFLHSLPHPRLLLRYAEAFDLTLLAWKRRFFAPGEYGALQEHFVARHHEGVAYVAERAGRRFLVGGTWMAARR